MLSDILKNLNSVNSEEFAELGHATSQHRLFGFITTNIRRWSFFEKYLLELVPEYIQRKQRPEDWASWCQNPKNLKVHKQKFKRLELASLLFRQVEKNSQLNVLAEKLYQELKTGNQYFVSIFLALYLLKGRYWQIEKQPLVELNKIISSYRGNLKADLLKCVLQNVDNRILLFLILYNPSLAISEQTAIELLRDDTITEKDCQFILDLPIVKNRVKNAAGLRNFRADAFLILNYMLFKEACLTFAEMDLLQAQQAVIERYVELLFENKLNNVPGLFSVPATDKDALINFLQRFFKYLKNIALFALNIKEEDFYQEHQSSRKGNIKKESIDKFNGECFFAYHNIDREWHQQAYFLTRKNERYLEGHHIIKLEYATLFNNDLDVVENLIPLCPNCHRKLHNATESTVAKMLQLIYTNINKKEWIRKGIFVDIETLSSFYGLSKDIKEYK